MKRILTLVTLFFAINSYAQMTKPAPLNNTSTVVGEDGNKYPYEVWRSLLKTNMYGMKSQPDGSFLLYRYTEEQAAKALEVKKERIKTMAKPMPSPAFTEGDLFKGDRFVSLDKTKFDLKTNTGKIYIFNFWFINCPPCKEEIPELNELVKQYKDNPDVVFLGIALDPASDLRTFLKTTPFNYNIIPDGRYFSQKYGVKSYPTHAVVGKDGLIKFSGVGLASNTIYWLEKTIKEQVGEAGESGK